jgi:hypothetical protein
MFIAGVVAECPTGTQPLITALQAASTDLEAKQADVTEQRQALNAAYSAMCDSRLTQRTAFHLSGLAEDSTG